MCGVFERLKHVWKEMKQYQSVRHFRAELGDLRQSSTCTWKKRNYTCEDFWFVQVFCQMHSYKSEVSRLLCGLCIGYAFDTPAWTCWCGLISGLRTYFFPIMGASPISGAKAALELRGLSSLFGFNFLWLRGRSVIARSARVQQSVNLTLFLQGYNSFPAFYFGANESGLVACRRNTCCILL